MSWADIKHSLRGDNHESVGTRIGLYIDPLHYLSKLWGGQKQYDAFVNKSGDFLNKQGSSVVKPIDKFGRKYDPLHKEITSTEGGDEAAKWIVNKPATTAGVVYGGVSGAQALGGAFGGGEGGSSGGGATSTGGGFNWQQYARLGGNGNGMMGMGGPMGGQQQPKNTALEEELRRQALERSLKEQIAEQLGQRYV